MNGHNKAEFQLMTEFSKDDVLAQAVIAVGDYWYEKGFHRGMKHVKSSNLWGAIFTIVVSFAIGVLAAPYILGGFPQ